jgi:NAD(P)-dependent dehydrogenase (short-subunit alcohol dehydrogenase family)
MTQDIYDAARKRGAESFLGMLNPLRRGGQSVEVAQAIAFLASEDASYVNGHALVVDGGVSSSLPFARPPQLGRTSY